MCSRVASSVKIFERVEGARLVGSAAGATEVEVRLALHADPSSRDFEYLRRVRVASDGRFEVVVPYSTRLAPDPTKGREVGSEIVALGAYSLQALTPSGTVRGSTHVTTGQIRSGARIEIGSLAGAENTAPPSQNP